jgi:hypothetical protein
MRETPNNITKGETNIMSNLIKENLDILIEQLKLHDEKTINKTEGELSDLGFPHAEKYYKKILQSLENAEKAIPENEHDKNQNDKNQKGYLKVLLQLQHAESIAELFIRTIKYFKSKSAIPDIIGIIDWFKKTFFPWIKALLKNIMTTLACFTIPRGWHLSGTAGGLGVKATLQIDF